MQEQILKYFADISNPILDHAAEFITMLGEQYFFIMVITFLYWNLSKKEGFKLAAAFLVSATVNAVLKMAFHTLRPFEKLDYIKGKRVETATGYSFPSGHTQGSTTFLVTMSQIARERWFTVISIILILLIGVSRVYLGVHWPVDVIGGWVFGIVISYIVCTLVDKYWNEGPALRRVFFRFQIVVLFGSVLLFILDLLVFRGAVKIHDYFKIAGISSGAIYGFFIEERYTDFSAEDAGRFLKIIRYIIGLAGTVGIMIGLKLLFPGHYLFDFLRYAAVGIWVTFLWPAAGIGLRLFNRRSRVS